MTPCFLGVVSEDPDVFMLHMSSLTVATMLRQLAEQDTVALLRGLHVSCTGVFMLLADCNKVCIFRHFHKDLQ